MPKAYALRVLGPTEEQKMTRRHKFERHYGGAVAVLKSIAQVARAGRTGDAALIAAERKRHALFSQTKRQIDPVKILAFGFIWHSSSCHDVPPDDDGEALRPAPGQAI
jgi:hypothetical protein